MDKLLLGLGAVGWIATIYLFLQWRKLVKKAHEADFWQKLAEGYAKVVTKKNALIKQKELEIRVLETKIVADYDDQQLNSELNGILRKD